MDKVFVNLGILFCGVFFNSLRARACELTVVLKILNGTSTLSPRSPYYIQMEVKRKR